MFEVISQNRPVGIRQRSLTRHCRLGRATELVFVMATGAMLVIAGDATAQANLSWDPVADAGPGTITPGDGVWDGATTNWTNGAANVAFAAGDNATFTSTGAPYTVSVDAGGITAGNINFAGNNVRIGGAGMLTIGGTLSADVANAGTVAAAIGGNLTTGGLGTLNINGGVAGTTNVVSLNDGRFNMGAGAFGNTVTVTSGFANVVANTTVTNGVLINGGTFNSITGRTLTSAGGVRNVGGTLHVNGGIIGNVVNEETATIGGNVTGSYTQNVDGAASTTVDANSSVSLATDIQTGSFAIDTGVAYNATGGMTVSGTSTMNIDGSLRGNVSNTSSGNVTLGSAGGAEIRNGYTLNNAAATTTIDGMATIGTLTLTAGTLQVNNQLTLSNNSTSAGTVDINANVLGGRSLTSTGAITLSGGYNGSIALNTAASTLTVDGLSTLGRFTNTGGTVTVGSQVTLSGASSSTGTLDVNANILGNQTITNSGTMTLAANITGGVAMTAGSTLTVDGASGITGRLENTGGTVNVNNALNLGMTAINAGILNVDANVTGGSTITNTGTINVSQNTANSTISGSLSQTSAAAVTTIHNTSTLSGGFNNTAGTVNVNGALALGADASNAGTLNIRNSISNVGGTRTITNTGATVINGTNPIVVASAIRQAGTNATLTIGSNATLTGGFTNAVNNAVIVNNTLALGARSTNAGTLDINSTVNGGATIANTGAVTLAGTINGAIDQSGTGSSLVVDGNSTITNGLTNATGGSVTVNAGQTLMVSSLTNSGAVNVRGTLQGTANTINNAGTLTVANGGAVTDAGNLINQASGTVNYQGAGTLNVGGAGEGLINNAGLLQVNGSSVAQTVAVGGDSILNQGTGRIDLNGGTLNGIVNLTNNSSSAAAIDVANGASLGFGQLTSSTGTITNAGTMTGNVTLSGAANLDLNPGGTITGNVIAGAGNGAVTLGGTITGNYTQTAGSTTVDGATTITGNYMQSAGTTTTSAQTAIGGNFTLNGGTTSIQAATAITGISSIGVATFGVADGFTAVVGDGATAQNEFTALSGSTINVGSTPTGSSALLRTNQPTDSMTFNSGSVLNLNGSSMLQAGTLNLDGLVNAMNASGGGLSGNVLLGSTGHINMRDGATGDSAVVSGALTASQGSSLSVDVNLAENNVSSDTLTVQSAGSSGTLLVNINDTTTGRYGSTGNTGLVIVDLADTTSTVTPTTTTTPVDPDGQFTYQLENVNGDIVLTSQLTGTTVGLTGAIALSQSLVASVINRPSSPYATRPINGTESEVCRPGAWARLLGGEVSAEGTAQTGNTNVTTTTSSSSFQGLQVGSDLSCAKGAGETGWDFAIGASAGLNQANTNQDIPDPTNIGLIANRTQLELRQAYGGVYAVARNKQFQGDVQVRYEHSDYTINSTAITGVPFPVDNTKFTTKAVSAVGAVSYGGKVPNVTGLNWSARAGLSATQTQAATISLTNGTRIELDDAATLVAFVGGTLSKAWTKQDQVQVVFGTLTHFKNLSDSPSATFVDSTGRTTNITSSPLADYTELSLGYSYNRILSPAGGGPRRILGTSIRASASKAPNNKVDGYALTAQIRLQF